MEEEELDKVVVVEKAQDGGRPVALSNEELEAVSGGSGRVTLWDHCFELPSGKLRL
jgi:hypothetical protein